MSVTKGWGVDCTDWPNKRETTIDQGERIIMFFVMFLPFEKKKPTNNVVVSIDKHLKGGRFPTFLCPPTGWWLIDFRSTVSRHFCFTGYSNRLPGIGLGSIFS
jgi:hypothetical protein